MRMIRYAASICMIVTIGLLAAFTVNCAKQTETKVLYYENKAIVLLYHDVREQLPRGSAVSSTISTEQLSEHLKMFKEKGFNVIGMDEFVKFMKKEKKIPPNALVLTFDDGYESFYSEAVPILEQFNAPASNFIVGVSSDLFNPEAQPHLSWEQMRSLKAKGIGIFNHTYNLHRKVLTDKSGSAQPALTARMYMEQVRKTETEIQYSQRIYSDLVFMEKRLRQELGPQHALLAFPYGAYDDMVLKEARKAGIELVFTITEGMNDSGNEIVKRINAGEPYMTADALWSHLQTYF